MSNYAFYTSAKKINSSDRCTVLCCDGAASFIEGKFKDALLGRPSASLALLR